MFSFKNIFLQVKYFFNNYEWDCDNYGEKTNEGDGGKDNSCY